MVQSKTESKSKEKNSKPVQAKPVAKPKTAQSGKIRVYVLNTGGTLGMVGNP